MLKIIQLRTPLVINQMCPKLPSDIKFNHDGPNLLIKSDIHTAKGSSKISNCKSIVVERWPDSIMLQHTEDSLTMIYLPGFKGLICYRVVTVQDKLVHRPKSPITHSAKFAWVDVSE